MKLIPQEKLNKALDKALLKHRPFISEIELFKTELIKLLDHIDNSESEEFNKNLVSSFLTHAFYANTHFINTKDRQDLVIHNGKTNKTSVGVIIEAKRPTHKSDWLTPAQPNSKALQELVLYYLRERIEGKNIDIKFLIATNINEWYIIEASYFKHLFYDNKKFVKQYEEWRDGKKDGKETAVFYNDIAKPFIDGLTDEIPCTYFNIRECEKVLRSKQPDSNKDIIGLFKILSPYHLLKAPFANDSNELDDKFYKELLHIIGLEEVKEGSKNIIRRKIDNRNIASLLEKAIEELKTEGLHKVPDLKNFGDNREEQYFNIALELCITWINRVLFLKLLEGQLINYHKGDQQYRFLNSDIIPTFSELFTLFHRVLAVDIPGRSPAIQHKYSRVPYLNSSLFEISDLEDVTIKINAIDSSETLEFIGSTILKEHKRKNEQLKTIDYLFQFLDAYDFASEDTRDTREDTKTLINASVLGKVFEKINGYKDGSIYTPGFITMYMSRQSIRLAVLQKFNDANGWGCKDFEGLKEFIEYRQPEARNLANAVINGLKLCDPAVGSGHFLVSALNEIIAIKSELNILQDINRARLKAYTIEVINDELSVFDEDNEPFTYNPKSQQSQLVQQTLFTEKQTIIENCLFGVDINPNSVKICRLRLWIELLKSAYYKQDGNLETLPNIDINIKCGNSLLSRCELNSDLSQVFKQKEYSYKKYKKAVESYKNTSNKKDKEEFKQFIQDIKEKFKEAFSINDKLLKDLSSKRGQLYLLDSSNIDLFGNKILDPEEIEFEKKRINLDILQIETKIQEKKDNTLYKNAFEWRFEFPEVLNNNGDFEGFDVVIGNPPYGASFSNSLKLFYKEYFSHIHVRTPESFNYFVSRFVQIGKSKSIASLIIPSSFLNQIEFEKTRKYLLDNYSLNELLNLGDNVFIGITAPTCIISISKGVYSELFNYADLSKIARDKLSIAMNKVYLKLSSITFKSNTSYNFIHSINKALIDKCYINTPTLKNITEEVATGISSGLDKAYVFTELEVKNKNLETQLLKKLIIGGEINRYKLNPISTKKIIYITDENNIQDFPNIEKEITQYKQKLELRREAANGTIKWYSLNWPRRKKLFERDKILIRQTANRIMAAFDNDKWYCLKSGLVVQLPEKSEYSYFYLLALLNSSLLDFLYKDLVNEDTRIFPEVKPIQLFKLPIKPANDKIKTDVELIVENIIESKQQGQDTTPLEQQIDALVYQLYDLTPDEIAIVENSTVSKQNEPESRLQDIENE